MSPDRISYEVARLWLMANEEKASPEDLDKLNALLSEEPAARSTLIRLTQHQGWLVWRGVSSPGMALGSLQSPSPALTGEPVVGAAAVDRSSGNGQFSLNESRPARSQPITIAAGRAVTSAVRWCAGLRVEVLSVRMLAIVVAVAAITVGLTAGRKNSRVAQPTSAGQPVRAEIISSTLCLWNDSSDKGSANGRSFQRGDALELLEGVAVLSIATDNGDAILQLEGPVGFVLGREGISNLKYGKITVKSSHDDAPFVVGTSFGRVVAQPGSEVGVGTFGSQAEVHVFDGLAFLESPWLVSDSGDLVPRGIAARKAIRIEQSEASGVELTHLTADRSRFTPKASSKGSYLRVDQSYVRAVKESNPVAYWRFEGADNGRVRNEMGAGFEGVLSGDYHWVGPEGNRSIEFGVLPHPGKMRVRDSWDSTLAGDFAFEFWIKPSHFHHGTIISLAGPFNWQLKKNPLGIAVETVGGWGDGASTNRVRFLLREPVGYFKNGSTYSQQTYSPRMWQHIVACRKGEVFNTYLDGELVQSLPGDRDTPPGLELIVGKLYTDELYRPFVGCVDELAVYDRALEPEEVSGHFEQMSSEGHPEREI